MRILAVDYGSKRIGLALSDETHTIASPVGYISARPLDKVMDELKKISATHKVGLIIIGLPLNMDGTEGPAAVEVREFAALVEKTINTPVKLIDERLTTVAAERLLIEGRLRREKRKLKRDAMAAAILLQGYLDSAQPD